MHNILSAFALGIISMGWNEYIEYARLPGWSRSTQTYSVDSKYSDSIVDAFFKISADKLDLEQQHCLQVATPALRVLVLSPFLKKAAITIL